MVGDFAGIQHRSQSGFDIVAMVSVPAAADIGFLFGFLADLGDLRVAFDGAEEAIDVDRAEFTGEIDVLLRGQRLIPEEHHTMFGQRRADIGNRVLAQRLDEIDPE